jgi:cobalt-zinc-cadmium efflux system membrane fusion protein
MKPSQFDSKTIRTIAFIVLAGIALLAVILFAGKKSDGSSAARESAPAGSEAGEHGPTDENKGPHGGTLLSQGNNKVEVLLAEEGGRARHRLWLYENDKPVAPTAFSASERIKRADGMIQDFVFVPEKDSQIANGTIDEPHIFEATIAIRKDGATLQFKVESEEGKIELADAQIKTAGIVLAKAGPARIRSVFELPGEIRFNEDRTAHVVPRLSGVVESVPVNLGGQVKKGQALAVIASAALSEMRSELLATQKRQTLAQLTYEREKKLWQDKISAEQDYLQAQQALREAEIATQNARQKLMAIGASTSTSGGLNRFELRAPFDGSIVEKHITLGESVKEDANVFTVADLSTVWAEIIVPAKDLGAVRVGTNATVKATSMDTVATGTVSYVGSLLGEETRTAKARVTLPNPKSAWRPGLFVNVELTADERDVPVAVASEAIQTVGDKPVVFVKIEGGFFPQPVVTGRSDGKFTEVIKGLSAGAGYVAGGSFVLKAELGKDSAEHAH